MVGFMIKSPKKVILISGLFFFSLPAFSQLLQHQTTSEFNLFDQLSFRGRLHSQYGVAKLSNQLESQRSDHSEFRRARLGLSYDLNFSTFFERLGAITFRIFR